MTDATLAVRTAPAAATPATSHALETGRRVLMMERDAIDGVLARLDASFTRAVEIVRTSSGRVIVTGVGKSGLIARKIAATLTSTGTSATFLHPVESVHGDLGIVGSNDVAILLSKSGETPELLPLLDHFERFGVTTIAITGCVDSTLGRHVDVTLDAWVASEACPHDLAPTTSTTAALAIGDALAVALLEAKGFRSEDFARLHPGGALGRRLLMRVQDVMIATDLPLVHADDTLRTVVVTLMKRRGIAIIVDAERRVDGVFTPGDLTRRMSDDNDHMTARVGDVMNRHAKTARVDELASAVVYRMEQYGIVAMPVLDDAGQVVGVVHLHDLLRAGAA